MQTEKRPRKYVLLLDVDFCMEFYGVVAGHTRIYIYIYIYISEYEHFHPRWTCATSLERKA
jgi:hypothetical protein